MNPSGHILLVDDDDDVRAALAEVLESHGYRVRQAGDGVAALQVASEQRPALILLDLSMPVLDGWSTLEQLRRDPDLRTVPVIIVTAESTAPDGLRSVEKPYRLERVLDVIQGAVAGTR